MSANSPVRPSDVERAFTRDECLSRLARSEVGRIAFPARHGVDVLPVNHAIGPDHSVIIRSAAGAKLAFAQREPHAVAFETDGLEEDGTAWWVTVVGKLSPVLDLIKLPALTRLEIAPWADAVERPHFLRLEPSKVVGGTVRLGPRHAMAEPRPATTSGLAGHEDHATDRGGLEVLGTEECLHLLAAAPMGRVAFMFAGQPTVVPAVPGRVQPSGHVVVRTRTNLAPVLPTQPIAFQVDAFDADDRTGWSVLVRGVVNRLSDAAEAESTGATGADHSELTPEQWIRVLPDEISGRRIRPRA